MTYDTCSLSFYTVLNLWHSIYGESIPSHTRLIPADQVLALLLWIVALGEEHTLIAFRLLIRTYAAWLDFLSCLSLRLQLGGEIRGLHGRL